MAPNTQIMFYKYVLHRQKGQITNLMYSLFHFKNTFWQIYEKSKFVMSAGNTIHVNSFSQENILLIGSRKSEVSCTFLKRYLIQIIKTLSTKGKYLL